MARRVLVFNFFSGIFQRGIPLYVDNLCIALEKSGVRAVQLRCPAFLRKRPRWLTNLLFVFCEQIVMPIAGLGFSRSIYPYNSVSWLASIFGQPLLIVHDFVSARRRNKAFAARYIRATEAIHDCRGGDVAFISRDNCRMARVTQRYRRSPVYLFPNAFFAFAALRASNPPARENYVLLCSGWGKNKDLEGALQLYLDSKLYEQHPLHILGLQAQTERVAAFCAQHPELQGKITVLPRMDDADVVGAYERAAWVWVHSLHEGFGRSIAEARLCGCRVVASNIRPFREQRDEAVTFYAGPGEFRLAAAECEAMPESQERREPRDHALLLAEIERYLRR